MKDVDELFQEIDEMEAATDNMNDAGERDNQFQLIDQKMEEAIDQITFDDLTQDQMVRFLEMTRRMSWDIPSALMVLCSHLDEGEYYFMHRVTDEKKKEMGYPRPDSAYQGPASVSEWAPADKHFQEVHGWDMNDKRINWDFDT